MSINKEPNQLVFLELLKAGLWESGVSISLLKNIEYNKIYKLAEEQSVIGLVAAGLEYTNDKPQPRDQILQFVGMALQAEKRNSAMNNFISLIIEKLKNERINPILVKGQGVAQCYERPFWRSSGDIDLLIDKDSFIQAKALFDRISETPCLSTSKNIKRKHLEYCIGPWLIELHGSLNTHLSNRIDKCLNNIQKGMFISKEVRNWRYDGTDIQLPSPDNDVIVIFTHILQHFFLEGIGLRQICDLCRLLWTYRETINRDLLFSRIDEMGVMSEWKTTGCLMVDYLGLPEQTMPFYDTSYKSKAKRMLSYIIESGNFGHNKDFSHLNFKCSFVRKVLISWRQFKDSAKLTIIFPVDGLRFYLRFLYEGVAAAII